jgi:hypothetical protein
METQTNNLERRQVENTKVQDLQHELEFNGLSELVTFQEGDFWTTLTLHSERENLVELLDQVLPQLEED